jgi:signal transduction histidine kinase
LRSIAQAGKLKFHPSPLNLEAFCRDVFEQMQFTDTVGHEFVFMAEGDFANVSLDEKILRHILINLLSNAIKYSPGGGEIRLQLSRSERDVTLRISDQGIGIPVEDQARIFEVFHRASNAEAFAGTGLGLAIVKSNVEAHGGTIMFDSNQGQGTAFTVRLPLGT